MRAVLSGAAVAPPRIVANGAAAAGGRAHGEAAATGIARHVETVLARLAREGVGQGEAERRALAYRDAVAAQRPELAEEVDGVARGAGIARELAWVLQLRAELAAPTPECSSLAARGADGELIVAQNLDLPPAYRELMVLLERREPGRPALLTLTPAGQIGQCGINAAGVAVFANFIHAPGWRVGLPRYLLSRVALAERDRAGAIDAVAATRRAASRNLLVADPGGATMVETTPDGLARVESEGRFLWHTNHVVAPELAAQERAGTAWLRNSRARYARIGERLEALTPTEVSVEAVAEILRDRTGAPDAVCHLREDDEIDYATVASVIAIPARRRMWVAWGPPCDVPYVEVEAP
ncbi:C45 family autoproteolytic acyltransferase/hydolase [Conexibacter arvalis]|uniref:Isopenicillin-N N-acyltransferase-like protein n=1 Tax=Conexibacter arvalis TaxID=912552 RepID=A0A840IHI2_9ACTN|nr:isopenicillin-N N-acyltransferase-like protein [Conexibacter arvalis]